MVTKVDASVVGDQVIGRRNLIINGDMRINQRGDTTGSTGFYSIDRWRTYSSANVAVSQQTFTVGQTDVPNFPKNYIRLVPTSATFTLSQRIEDVTVLGGKEVTLSFWIKGSAAQTFGIQHTRYYGSGGSSAESTTVATNFNVTTSWTKVTSTFTVPSVSGKTINAGSYFQLTIGGGGEFTSSNTIEITQVQLEVGDTATSFEHRSLGEELNLCKRYYQQLSSIYGHPCWCWATNTCGTTMPLDVEMRINPTGTYGGNFGNLQSATNEIGIYKTAFVTVNSMTIATDAPSSNARLIRLTFALASSSVAANDAVGLYMGIDAIIKLDSEL